MPLQALALETLQGSEAMGIRSGKSGGSASGPRHGSASLAASLRLTRKGGSPAFQRAAHDNSSQAALRKRPWR
jgi:hypothetical protein